MTNRRKKTQGYYDPDVRAEIERLTVAEGWRPIHIQKHLESKPDYAGRLPPLRTIQHYAKQVRPPADPSGSWTLASAEGDEAALILPVLAAIQPREWASMDDITYVDSGGVGGRLAQAAAWPHQKRAAIDFTQAEGEWICRVRRAVPDLRPLIVVYHIARFYVSYEARAEPSAPLDALLAFAPWRGPAAWERYQTAVAQGWAKRAALPWTLVTDYREGLKAMGFSPAGVDAAQGYGDLLERERQGGVEP